MTSTENQKTFLPIFIFLQVVNHVNEDIICFEYTKDHYVTRQVVSSSVVVRSTRALFFFCTTSEEL